MIIKKLWIISLSILLNLSINNAQAAADLNSAASSSVSAVNSNSTAAVTQSDIASINNQKQGVAVNTTDSAVSNPNENLLVMELASGKVIIELNPAKAPQHVQRIKELAREGFYDGVTFHRVIDGFMAQTGDPSGTGMGKSQKPDLKAEFNDIKHVRGVVSMARSSNPDSANSQFFIMFAEAPSLDSQYSAFGKVISGMEFVDKIKKGDHYSGKVEAPADKIISLKVAADIPGFTLPGVTVPNSQTASLTRSS